MNNCNKNKRGKDVVIPESVTSIWDSAFYGCSGLTSISIPESVTTIGSYAFCKCIGLTSINIPKSVTTIGDSAFSGCSNLTSISIPISVTTIGDSAFNYCDNLKIKGTKGSYAESYSKQKNIDFIKLAVKGDANGDDKIDLDDVNLVLKHALTILILDSQYQESCDLDNDGDITLTDVNIILKLAIGIVVLK